MFDVWFRSIGAFRLNAPTRLLRWSWQAEHFQRAQGSHAADHEDDLQTDFRNLWWSLQPVKLGFASWYDCPFIWTILRHMQYLIYHGRILTYPYICIHIYNIYIYIYTYDLYTYIRIPISIASPEHLRKEASRVRFVRRSGWRCVLRFHQGWRRPGRSLGAPCGHAGGVTQGAAAASGARGQEIYPAGAGGSCFSRFKWVSLEHGYIICMLRLLRYIYICNIYIYDYNIEKGMNNVREHDTWR